MQLSRRAMLASLCAPAALTALKAAAQNGFIELRAAESRGSSGQWGFNGRVPGPLLRARQGREFRLRLYNNLREPIAIHWHGIRLTNAMDGTSLTQFPVRPGNSFDYVFTPPDAGTFWYRTTTNSLLQRRRGLYGLLIVENEDGTDDLFDVPVIIDDRQLQGNIQQHLSAPAGRYLRLRILNAATSLFLSLRLNVDAEVIAYDGQPARPAPLGRLTSEIAPGQRLDLLVAPSAPLLILSAGAAGRTFRLLTILREPDASAGVLPPAPLEPNPLPAYFNYAALHHVSFTIEGGKVGNGPQWSVNGHSGLAKDPLFSVPSGTTVAVTVDNITRHAHALHLHGHAARLMEVAGRPVAELVWRDTFIIRPLEPAKILFIADNPGKWLMASTIAGYFEAGLAAWFEVR
jgi:FtsP/CotA-like multicopper oxidase with cupredoxin domain